MKYNYIAQNIGIHSEIVRKALGVLKHG